MACVTCPSCLTDRNRPSTFWPVLPVTDLWRFLSYSFSVASLKPFTCGFISPALFNLALPFNSHFKFWILLNGRHFLRELSGTPFKHSLLFSSCVWTLFCMKGSKTSLADYSTPIYLPALSQLVLLVGWWYFSEGGITALWTCSFLKVSSTLQWKLLSGLQCLLENTSHRRWLAVLKGTKGDLERYLKTQGKSQYCLNIKSG